MLATELFYHRNIIPSKYMYKRVHVYSKAPVQRPSFQHNPLNPTNNSAMYVYSSHEKRKLSFTSQPRNRSYIVLVYIPWILDDKAAYEVLRLLGDLLEEVVREVELAAAYVAEGLLLGVAAEWRAAR